MQSKFQYPEATTFEQMKQLRDEWKARYIALWQTLTSGQFPGVTEMPGAYRCPKCKFTLQKNILAPSGVFADTRIVAPERCPNDNTIMEPLTWRQANEEIYATWMLETQRMNWLDAHCSFVADHEYNLGPFKIGELRKLADAGIAEDERRRNQ